MLLHEYLLEGFKNTNIILKHKDSHYTLSDVEKKVETFTKEFKKAKIKKGDRILLLMENGFNAISLQLCCSQMGVIYIPVSPFEPVNRILKIINQFDPVAALVDYGQFKTDFSPFFRCSFIDEEIILLVDNNNQVDFKEVPVCDNDILYIISTSGTTGNPKGIVMSHKSVICFFKAMVSHCKLSSSDNVGSISPLQFDFSLLDLGLAWGSKACISVFSQSYAYNPRKLIEGINKHAVTQFHSVPAIWNIILRYCKDEIVSLKTLKSILYAGDKFSFQNMLILREELPHLKIINCFGPTECIAFSFYDIPKLTSQDDCDISIGKGYIGNIFYLVDDEGNLIMENNVIGELWYSNGGLFEGYWKNENLTNQVLIKDPFDQSNEKKVYKSGDLMSRRDNGNYYFHGRKDNQIKVNGNRVELDEIEQLVLKHNNVLDAVAIAQKDGETNSIVLYISTFSEYKIEEDSIRKYCRSSLPVYMIPAKIYILNTPFPLTTNGKTDKKALLESIN